ncbi:hypothetical protein E3P92_01504 [Wallemia ichthyophaga]|uniref:Transcription factor CBF/NF-Y/archaeal histone domain-containing protein n=2 Tax=Wallemia ichthyophaga TaxID=245174 RepID=A0A4T0GGS5_WALIC|nr:Putative transcription factor C16C4.22 [Wallemia ichthyophaga EXF-994]TIA73637.1 hypothetical protein E3P91_01334 [Wallemia ichthyophaga]EOR01327.1 Putative transcription factor C16C4.22 [Wallemia ichthyophaga EXF-994]TIA82488.1 hypothetical protein E3P98_01355 [Wallemia ichthyophaga]TIB00906.1 hypothetical protein E3P95_01451 [Wallemia ichthyophaga]TIB01838.1 hypothetical protein E3P94_01583 [Wallemia ichthyophaga]
MSDKPSKKEFSRDKGTTHLPIARVQKIIKADKEMENCAKEATYLIAVATEYFIKYLTDAGYIQATLDKRNTIQYRDLANAVDKSEELEFLKEIVPSKLTMQKALDLQQRKQKGEDTDAHSTQDDAILFEPPHKNKKKTHAQADKLAKDQSSHDISMEE